MTKTRISKSTLLNIDSSYRDLYPKNICSSNNNILPLNPLTLTYKTITINYPNHNLSTDDNIVIQNVEGESKTSINSFYLVNNFEYFIIVYNNNNININYKDFVDSLFINIQIVGSQLSDNIINNICFNSLFGIKQSLIANNIPISSLLHIKTFASEILNIDITTLSGKNQINQNCLFVSLPYQYININNNYFKVNQIFKILYLHLGGVNISYINANYPINNDNYQSSQTVYNIIDENTFQIQLNNPGYGTSFQGGGRNVQIMKIINSITGYPDPNYYVINLKKSFNNVKSIQLISTEFPYVDILIQKDVNDKLYWKNIQDGQNIYNVVITEGFYSADTFISKLQSEMNSIPRYNNSNLNSNYNNFNIILESNIQKITFYSYNLTKLPNSLFCNKQVINSVIYYVITIKHPNNFLKINDNITINNSNSITINNISENNNYLLINSSYINKTFPIYLININSYDIILGESQYIETTSVETESKGGCQIVINSPSYVSFIFSYSDTIGNILGFKDVGFHYSIIDYKSSITNRDTYINSNNLNQVGNIIPYSSGFLIFVGINNYFLMYLNDIDYIQTSNIKPAFAKILLNGNPGDILFNTFINIPNTTYSDVFPLSDLSQLTISFKYSNGNNVNFRNINHSFTLEIVEDIYLNDDTHLNSQNISVIEEFSRARLK